MKFVIVSLLLLLISCGSGGGESVGSSGPESLTETITVEVEILDDHRNFECTEAPALWYKTEGTEINGSSINELIGNGIYIHTVDTHYEENHDFEIKIIPPASGNCPGIVARIYYDGIKFGTLAPTYPMVQYFNLTTDEIRELVDDGDLIAPDFFLL